MKNLLRYSAVLYALSFLLIVACNDESEILNTEIYVNNSSVDVEMSAWALNSTDRTTPAKNWILAAGDSLFIEQTGAGVQEQGTLIGMDSVILDFGQGNVLTYIDEDLGHADRNPILLSIEENRSKSMPFTFRYVITEADYIRSRE
jgi:hypothetical protein